MLQPIYNYLLTAYTPKSLVANRIHKPSELRNLYSHMIKLNQKSPLYKIHLSTDTQVFALSLKEASMELNQCLSDAEATFSAGPAADTEAALSHLESLQASFNHTLQLARNFGVKQPTANRVIRELKAAVSPYLSELEAAGLTFAEDGSLEIDQTLATEAVSTQELSELFSREKGPIQDLIRKTNYITLNPMNYVDKVLVTYPNLSKPSVGHPYASSIYSGLLFNYYC